MGRTILTDVDARSNPRHRQHSLFLRRGADIGSVPSSITAAAQILRAVGLYMAFLATPVAPPHWGTAFGVFCPSAIDTGSRGRATTDLVGAFAASSLLSPTSTFSFAAASTFPVATAAAAFSEAVVNH